MKKILAKSMGVLLLAMLCVTGAVKAKAVTWNETVSHKTTKGAFTFHAYLSENGKESWIYKVDVNAKKGSTKTLKFPAKVKGAKVTKLGYPEKVADYNVFDKKENYSELRKSIFDTWVKAIYSMDGYLPGLEKIKALILPDSVKDITLGAFSGMRSLKKVKLPDNLTKIKGSVFYGCKKLQKVTLPKKLKKFSPFAFMDCGSLKSVTISKKNKSFYMKKGMLLSKNKKTFYWVAPYKSKVKIPGAVKRIHDAAFWFSEATEIRIPKSVTKISKNALYGNWVQDIIIDKKNKAFFRKNDCVYDRKTEKVIWQYDDDPFSEDMYVGCVEWLYK